MAYSAEDFFSNYRKTFVIAPFKPGQVTPLGYDLRLGFMVSADTDDGVAVKASRSTSSQTKFTIKAGGAGIAVTLERLFLSGKVLGTVHARARLSLRGLALNAVTVDPNFGFPKLKEPLWHGSRLLLRIQNLSQRDITLTTEDDAIATLVLHEVQTETSRRPASLGLSELLATFRRESPDSISEKAATSILTEVSRRGTIEHNNGDKDLEKTEKEFRQAAEELLQYRSRERHSR